MTRLSLIVKACDELAEIRRWYGVRDEIGQRISRMVWEADTVAELHNLIWEGR